MSSTKSKIDSRPSNYNPDFRNDIVKAAAPPIVINVGGRQWRMSPPTLDDYAELVSVAQDQIIELVSRNASKYDDRTYGIMIKEALKNARSLNESCIQEAMSNVPAMTHFLWLLLRKNHPDLTMEEFNKIANSDGYLFEFTSALNRIEIRDGNVTQKKKGKKRRKRRKRQSR